MKRRNLPQATRLKQCAFNGKIFGCLTIILSAMILDSCITDQVEQEPIAEIQLLEKDKAGREFALLLATSLGSGEVRQFLKSAVSKQIDGDNNFLFQMEKNEIIQTKDIASGRQGSRTFSQILLNSFESRKGRTDETQNDFLKTLETQYPLLQVAIPNLPAESVENWNTQNDVPLVAYVPNYSIDKDEIEAYDINGTVYTLSTKTPPDKLVIVVSENERVIAVEKSAAKQSSNSRVPACLEQVSPMYESSEFNYYYRSDYYDALNTCEIYGGGGSGGGSGGGGNAGTIACDRDARANKDELVRMSFTEIKWFNDASGWLDGGLEIEVTISFARPNGAITKVTKFVTGPDRDFRDCPFPGFTCKPAWKGINTEIVTWDKAIYGDAMHYFWKENDSGAETTYSSTFSTTFDNADGSKSTTTSGLSFKISDKDDLLGEAIVEYCDKANGDGYEYNTGKIKFNVREK
jgi:hypothetical protein